MLIPLFKPKYRISECSAHIEAVLESGWTGYGQECLDFEKEWREYTQLPNAHFVNSNTSGLHLALEIFSREYGWDATTEVLTTPLTFISTNHTIIQAGLNPIFVDVDNTLCMSPTELERRITKRSKAVVFVGIGGNTGNYEIVRDICKKYNLILILDAAHLAGSKIHGRQVGWDADCSVFSFQAVKNLPTADSGMICFRESTFDQRCRKLSWMGIDKSTHGRSQFGSYQWRYNIDELGYKYHGNSIMAALGRCALRHLDFDNERRRELSGAYVRELSEEEKITIVHHNQSIKSSRHLFQIRVKNRDKMMKQLSEAGISTGVHYRNNLEYPMYQPQFDQAPVAAKLTTEALSLPLFPDLTFDQVSQIADEIKKTND